MSRLVHANSWSFFTSSFENFWLTDFVETQVCESAVHIVQYTFTRRYPSEFFKFSLLKIHLADKIWEFGWHQKKYDGTALLKDVFQKYFDE